jgi:hypothetical protein
MIDMAAARRGAALGFTSRGVRRTYGIIKPDKKNKRRMGEKTGDKKD